MSKNKNQNKINNNIKGMIIKLDNAQNFHAMK